MIRPHDAEPTLAERNALEQWFDGPIPGTALADLRARNRPHLARAAVEHARYLRAAAKSLREVCMGHLEEITRHLDQRSASRDPSDRAFHMDLADDLARIYESKMEQAEDYEREAAEIEKEAGR